MDVIKPEKLLEAHTCPLTGRPCDSPSLAECARFWQCVRQALASRRDEAVAPPRAVQPNPTVQCADQGEQAKQTA